MKKKLMALALLSASTFAAAHGWNDPHQSYQVSPIAKTIYIQTSINNYRADVDTFYIVVREEGEQIEFASAQRTYTQVKGSSPLTIGVYIKNDKPLPRTIQVCSNSYGKHIDVITQKAAEVRVLSQVCTIVRLRSTPNQQ
jgi:hypothetical protein